MNVLFYFFFSFLLLHIHSFILKLGRCTEFILLEWILRSQLSSGSQRWRFLELQSDATSFCRSFAFIVLSLYISTAPYSEKYTSCMALNFCCISQLAVFMFLFCCWWVDLFYLVLFSILVWAFLTGFHFLLMLHFFSFWITAQFPYCVLLPFLQSSGSSVKVFKRKSADWRPVLSCRPVLYRQHQMLIILFCFCTNKVLVKPLWANSSI